MNYNKWRPLYKKIIKKLDISIKKDKEARDILKQKIRPINIKKLNKKINNTAYIFGNSPQLKEEINKIDINKNPTKIVADSATKTVLNEKIKPDIVVTDLDGDIKSIKEAKKQESIIIVHAHGDNINKIKKHTQNLNPVIGTTQTKPLKEIHNFGGFTDGDRAAYLAQEFGAQKLEMIGFDFSKASSEKLEKLKIAEYLLNYLEKTTKINLNYID